jgi:hypothetical protein
MSTESIRKQVEKINIEAKRSTENHEIIAKRRKY